MSDHPGFAFVAALAPISIAFIPDVPFIVGAATADGATSSAFWSGPGTQAAAESWVAANGGTTLSFAAGATEAEVTAGSANLAAQARGVAVVFQNVAQGVPVAGRYRAGRLNLFMLD